MNSANNEAYFKTATFSKATAVSPNHDLIEIIYKSEQL